MGIYNINDFGAVADEKTVNTVAIQKAIDACHQAGGGTVVCGPGSFVTGTLMLKSNVELRLNAGCRITGSPSLDDYPDLVAPGFIGNRAPENSAVSLISAVEAENIAITGPGEVNGSGQAFYDKAEASASGKFAKPSTRRPRIVMFYKCRNVLIEDASFIDSACWTFWLMQCRDVNVQRVKIRGDRKMRNIDGIDIDSCQNVAVSDSFFDTEDDCVVVRSMQRLYDSPCPCENVTVSNCVLTSSCQGVRIGCPGDGVIRNCTFSNLVITGAGNGIVFNNPARYLPEGSSGSADVRNIVFSNVVIDCMRTPIKMDVDAGIALRYLGDVSFSGFRIKSRYPVIVHGSPETIIRNVKFSNIEIETEGENAVICRHCSGLKLDNVGISNMPVPASE